MAVSSTQAVSASSGGSPSGFDWLNAVWAGSETRGEVTLNSQLIDAQALALATQIQAALGSASQQYSIGSAVAKMISKTANGGLVKQVTIQDLINAMAKVKSSQMGVLNSEIASLQQRQSQNTQVASQGVQMETNQDTQVDTMNQTNVTQLLSALVGQMNQWSGFQIN